jgi:hypothetical protein
MKRISSPVFAGCVVIVSLSACGGNGATAVTSDGGSDATTGTGVPPAGADGSSPPVTVVDSGPIELGDGAPPPPTCTAPIAPVDTSTPKTVVGSGSAASCTEAAFEAAVTAGGIITFDCGGAATIPITSEKELSTKGDTVIDGGGLVTLDGGSTTRLLHFNGGNYRVTKTTVTLQNLTLAHAKATGTPIPSAAPPCSQGFEIDGGGGAILINDGELHVIGCTFIQNAAASPGPDVAGGAIYATGSLGVTIVRSRFEGNTASNGGAVGSLNSDLSITNTVFSQNQATGSGANSVDTSTCHSDGGEVGNGGNGGAVSVDGGSDGALTVCGATFEKNSSGALGGAMFRTPDGATQTSTFTQSTIDGNTAIQGGGGVYFHNSKLVIEASTISNNSAPGAGGIQADGTTLQLTNDTFAGNTATKGLGGAIALFGNGGAMTNCTFAGNQSSGGSGYFAAAIAGGDTFTIQNTLFANNTTSDSGSPMQCQETASGPDNVQWPKDHVTGGAADTACVSGITFADPELGALADNGGPTETMLPASTSPAAGIGTGCPATDQRGQPRKSTGCTAGAVELP